MGRWLWVLNHPAGRVAGPLAGLACGVTFVTGLDGASVGAAFGQADWRWLVPMLFLGCVNLWLRALRWGVLLAPATPVPTIQLLSIGLTAGLAGLGLPARGGDAVKVVLAARLPGVGLSDVAAAELLERLVDGAIFGGFIAAPALLGGVPGWPLALGLGALVVYLPLLAAIPCMSWYLGAAHEATGHGSHRAADELRSVVRLSGSTRLIRLVSDAARRRGPALVARAATLSLVAWATEALSYYCLLVAFGWLAPPTLPFAAVGVANFALAVPGPPAGVGAFHLPISSLLVDGFGAEPSLAAAFAVALHVGVLAPVPLLWALLAARARLQPTPVRVR